MSATDLAPRPIRRARRAAEFAALFVGAPVLMAVFFGQYSLFGVIWLLAGVSAMLLTITPGFRWASLWQGSLFSEWRLLLGYSALTALTCSVFVFTLVPERFLELPINRPALWTMIMVAYPVLSALPQELIFRTLFFERYGVLFPDPRVAVLANGAIFGFGHLFYMNPVTIGMTAVGGAIMGWAYLHRGRSLPLAWALHSLAGCLIFTSGLGVFFYSGAVGTAP